MPSVTADRSDPRLDLLRDWLSRGLGWRDAAVAPASADASFRRYFRVWNGERSLIVMDAPPEREDIEPFVRVAAALAGLGVTVPQVLEEDRAAGFLLLTDLGSTPYLSALGNPARVDALYRDATEALIRIQARGGQAAEALPPYDAALLDREIQLLPDWFLTRHLESPPSPADCDLLGRAAAQLVTAALEQPQVFVHRDFHSRNLMAVHPGNPGIIDFQDAVRGALTYDLVSLFKDCYIGWPRARVLAWVCDYRRRALAGGVPVAQDDVEFIRWFDLMGLQRHLKVLGIFARLWYRDAKAAYLRDLPMVLAYVLETTGSYGELAELDRFLREAVVPRFAAAQARALAL